MEYHALPDAALAALGAGRPDPATIAELRRAQRGRRLLLLSELVRAVPATTTTPWYAEIATLERTAPDSPRNPIADPLFGAWVADRLKALRAAAGPTAPHPDALPEAPPEPAPSWAAHPRGEQGRRWLVGQRDGLEIRVRLEDRDPRRGLLGLPPTEQLTDESARQWQNCFTDAWRILVDRHREAAEQLTMVLDCVVPVRSDPAARGISATSVDAFGAVALSTPPDGTTLAVGLLHETQHSLLNATTHLFDLHRHPGELGYSPWRDDPRPASGVLHGAYAYLAVTRFWRAEASRSRLAAFEFARWREAVDRAAAGLTGLTPAGARFVRALRAELRPWLTEEVDPEIQRLASAANLDHHLRWRLRNIRVVNAEAVAHAYLHGQDPQAVVSELVPAPRRSLESSTRLDLIHAALRDSKDPHPGSRGQEDPFGVPREDHEPQGTPHPRREPAAGTTRRPGGRATAADLAFVRGNHRTARDSYRQLVVDDPADLAAWTGLALLADLGPRLEVTVAGYRSLPTRPDPLAFAAWLAGRT